MEKKETKSRSRKKTDADKKSQRDSSQQKEINKLKEKLSECEKQLQECNEKYLRLAAETDNYRKRIQREMDEIIEYAGEKVLRNILPIIDDLERALNHSDEENQEKSLQKGLEMIYKKFNKALVDMGVRPIESLNQPFDPEFHHAVMAREVEEVDPDVVIEEFEKGYLFKKHVLRHAKVVVSK